MKKLIKWGSKHTKMILALSILLISTPALAAKDDIVCPCGCKQTAVTCGCPAAKKALRGA